MTNKEIYQRADEITNGATNLVAIAQEFSEICKELSKWRCTTFAIRQHPVVVCIANHIMQLTRCNNDDVAFKAFRYLRSKLDGNKDNQELD